MKNIRLPLLLIFALLLGACGRDDGPDTPPPAADTPAPATAAQPAEAPAGEAAPPAAAPTERAAEEVQPAPESAPPESADATAGKTAAPRDWQYSAGKHYSQLTSAQGTTSGPGSVEVTEVFWYGCPHCFSFDPIVKNWEGKQPSDVRFVRLPVMWNPTNEIHARMYYTAEALDKLEQMHDGFFTALHRDGKTLTREEDIRAFFGDFGVGADDFDKTFRSFAVESNLKRARNLTQRYRIRSVPVLVVDGKYVVDGPEIKSYGDMLAVADELVAKERLQR
jgi:thiol:disulfide interchange protein DsbA